MKIHSSVLVVNLTLIVVGLLMSEILLQLGSAWRPDIDRATGGHWYAPFLPDKSFGVKGNPRYPGHDFRGFRNARSMDKAAIVAMGSSHTYRRRRFTALADRTLTSVGEAGVQYGHAVIGPELQLSKPIDRT